MPPADFPAEPSTPFDAMSSLVGLYIIRDGGKEKTPDAKERELFNSV